MARSQTWGILFSLTLSAVLGGLLILNGNAERLQARVSTETLPNFTHDWSTNSDNQAMLQYIQAKSAEVLPQRGLGYNKGNAQTLTNAGNQVIDAPVAIDDAYGTNEDTVLPIAAPGVLGNDTDVDGDALTAVLVTPPVNGTLILNADGGFSYIPNADFNGSDSFSYMAQDPSLAQSKPATVTLTVNSVNDTPLTNNETSWNSDHWDNGNSRQLSSAGTRDPDDPTQWSMMRGRDTLVFDGNGIMTMSGEQPRIYLSFLGPEDIPNKFWKNVEATVYYKRVKDNSTNWGGIVIGIRSGPEGHTMEFACTATTYYARIRHDGKMDFQKELMHPASQVRESRPIWGEGPLPFDQWIGMKFVIHNVDNDQHVKLELYRDLTEGINGGVWENIPTLVDGTRTIAALMSLITSLPKGVVWS